MKATGLHGILQFVMHEIWKHIVHDPGDSYMVKLPSGHLIPTGYTAESWNNPRDIEDAAKRILERFSK